MKKFFLILLAAFGWMQSVTADAAETHFIAQPIFCHEFTVSPFHCMGNTNKKKWMDHSTAQIHQCNNTETFAGGAQMWTGYGGFNGSPAPLGNGCLLAADYWDWIGDDIIRIMVATSYDGCENHWYQITGSNLFIGASDISFIGGYDIDSMFTTSTGQLGCGGIIN